MSTLPPQPCQVRCETILSAVDAFIYKERAGLQAEIQRLQAENTELLRGSSHYRRLRITPLSAHILLFFAENGELLRQTTKALTAPAAVAVTSDNEKQVPAQLEPKDALLRVLLAKVHHCQRFLVKEREAFAQREAGFDQSFRALRGMVEQVVKTQHRRGTVMGTTAPPGRAHHSAPASPTPRRDETQRGPRQATRELVDRVMELTANLSQRAEEVKARCPAGPIVSIANPESISKSASSQNPKPPKQRSESPTSSENPRGCPSCKVPPPPSSLFHADSAYSRAHNNQIDFELDVLNLRLRRLEAATLEYVPPAEQDMILDFEAYRDELGKVRSRQKMRRKREERWGLWSSGD